MIEFDKFTAGLIRTVTMGIFTTNQTKPDVSVVILTKNSARTIERCLRSVFEEDPAEIVVVDASSTDGTLSVLRRYDVRVLSDDARSLASARQLGVEAVGGKYVMFVDSDVELVPGSIDKLKIELEKFGWAAIHARIIGRSNSTYWERAENDKFAMFFNQPGPHGHIGTIAALYRRDLLLEHPFDPDFVESAEDTDVCQRLGRDHYVVGVSTATAYHSHRADLRAFFKQRLNYGKGWARFAFKYGLTIMLARPLRDAFICMMKSSIKGKVQYIPYWFVDGFAQFIGVMQLVSSRHLEDRAS